MNESDRIFVFGSNMAGRHGKGAALHAYRVYGAKTGIGIGHIGNSYAIPTKDHHLRSLKLAEIEPFVKGFLAYAFEHPELHFSVTKIGCGLAGYSDHEIAPMFNSPASTRANVWFDEGWREWLLPGKTNFFRPPI